MFKYGKKSLDCLPLQLYMGLVIREHGKKSPMQMYAFLFRTGLRNTEDNQFMFGVNNDVIKKKMCQKKTNQKPKQLCMYLDTVLEGSSLLREQNVAHHSQWKVEPFLLFSF